MAQISKDEFRNLVENHPNEILRDNSYGLYKTANIGIERIDLIRRVLEQPQIKFDWLSGIIATISALVGMLNAMTPPNWQSSSLHLASAFGLFAAAAVEIFRCVKSLKTPKDTHREAAFQYIEEARHVLTEKSTIL